MNGRIPLAPLAARARGAAATEPRTSGSARRSTGAWVRSPAAARPPRRWSVAGLTWAAATGLGLLLASRLPAQTPVSNLVFTVGTTIQAGSGGPWLSYLRLGSPQPRVLAGKSFAVYRKLGNPTNNAPFTLRGTIAQQSDPAVIGGLLNQSTGLGQDLSELGQALNTLLHGVPGITNVALPQKVALAFQVAASDPATAQAVGLLAHMNPGLTLCAGQAFSEAITNITTYEVRDYDAGTGVSGDVVGRVTLTPGLVISLPAPGYPFQVVTNAARDHLVIRLRWGTPDELRRLALLSFGFNVWRIPRAAAEAAGFNVTPPTLATLYGTTNFTRANTAPVMALKDFSTGHGPGAADDPADTTTYFFADNNGHSVGRVHFPTNGPPHVGYLNPAFVDGEQFYYFVTARDLLGRDGAVSPGALATAYRRLPPQAPTELRVNNAPQIMPLGGGAVTNQPRLLVSWRQNTNATDQATGYWVYRWPNPTMALTNDAAPLDYRIAVVPQTAGASLNSYLDNGADAPSVPGPSNFWYTVRAVSDAAAGPLLSPHSAPAWGVLRQRDGPPATAGEVLGSCGVPVVATRAVLTLTNTTGAPDLFHWNYRLVCGRRDPGVAWVQFFLTNQFGGVETLGPLYFPPDGNVLRADYTLTVSGTNDVAMIGCVVGTFHGQVSEAAIAPVTAMPAANQRVEAVFVAGELLLTALGAADPLLAAIGGGPTDCLPAYDRQAYPDGTVRLRFDTPGATPLLIQVMTNNTPGIAPLWSSLGVARPDPEGFYWISYPSCLLGPLPPFRGCVLHLPGAVDCDQHVPREGGSGPVAPTQVRFRLTPRTHEYRLYRRVDDAPPTLIAQGGAVYDPADPWRTIVRTDDAMPPTGARLCYYVQLLDENGNGSPLALIGCKEVEPPKLPRPVLAEPQSAGATNDPQVTLTWFCPTSGVYRFAIKIERADQPGSGRPSGITGAKLTLAPAGGPAFYYGLFEDVTLVAHFDEDQLTPPLGSNFGPGPQFSLTANLLANVPYHISVVAMDVAGNAGDPSAVVTFTWQPPTQLPTVPWPARPLPAVRDFDDVPPPPLFGGPRVAAVLLRDLNRQLDVRYPVGIRIGRFTAITPPPETIGATNFVTYQVTAPAGLAAFFPVADPQTLLFRRLSPDPSRQGALILPIVVYRQQVTNAVFPRVSGHLTQVTPLLERLPYGTTPCPNCPSPTTVVTIYDRLIGAGLEFPTAGTDIAEYFLYVRDQQPVMAGASYQYFVARLNDQREIAEVIPAGVVTIP